MCSVIVYLVSCDFVVFIYLFIFCLSPSKTVDMLSGSVAYLLAVEGSSDAVETEGCRCEDTGLPGALAAPSG